MALATILADPSSYSHSRVERDLDGLVPVLGRYRLDNRRRSPDAPDLQPGFLDGFLLACLVGLVSFQARKALVGHDDRKCLRAPDLDCHLSSPLLPIRIRSRGRARTAVLLGMNQASYPAAPPCYAGPWRFLRLHLHGPSC